MITIRRSQDRGQANIPWLKSLHTFSFGSYQDPAHMGFGQLRVINEDRVIPGEGFATHSHQDMEIITIVLSGALEHRDSIGNGSLIKPGDIQRMSAGTGISHSEYNASKTEPVHFLQIWIIPNQMGLPPSYEQRQIQPPTSSHPLQLIGSEHGRDHSITIHQDVDLYAATLSQDDRITYPSHPQASRQQWIQVTQGRLQVNDEILEAGDGAAIITQKPLELVGMGDRNHGLLFDLAL